MQMRESLNRNPVVTIAVVVVVIALSIYCIFRFGRRGLPKVPPPVTQYYFTTDDGKTFFAADRMKVPPFKTDDGQEAVRAHVFNCEHDKTLFVGYLERFTPAAKAEIEAADPKDRARQIDMNYSGQEVKRAGPDNRWVSPRREQEFMNVQDIKDPHDSTKYAHEVQPGQ